MSAATMADVVEERVPSGGVIAALGRWVRRERTDAIDVETLYRRYGDMVLARCRTLLRNEADAQEAAQEVFLRVHRYRDGFRGEASPTTYLYRVTTTTCLNRLRTRRRHPEELYDELPPSPSLHDPFEDHAARDTVLRVLELADPKTRVCLVYHYIDGMTHAEVGEVVGLSAGAVRKRIRVFREQLATRGPDWLEELAG